MFEERAEHVYFIDDARTQAFIDGVSRHLELERFHPGENEAESSEPPAHYVTTLYFDSESQALARACESGTSGVRLRAREYLDVGPKLGDRRESPLFLEVKTRSGASTRKVRFAMASHDAHTILQDGFITEHVIDSHDWQASAEPVLREIIELCTNTAAPLKPDCVVRCRRRAWENAEQTLRITLDTELAFHRPPANLFETGMPLNESMLEPPVAHLGHCLVEIKQRGEAPTWLAKLIEDVGLDPAFEGRHAFSKFVAASHAVHNR